MSDGYLTYQFGLAPLISDIQRLLTVYADFYTRYKKFVKENNVVLYARNSERVLGGPETFVLVFDGNPWDWGYYKRNSDLHKQCTIKYRYEIIGATPPPTPRLLLKWMGLRGDPRIIWNAIPFSFVVDWVYKVGDWLSKWDEGAIPYRLHIIDVCVSCKRSQKKRYVHKYAFQSDITSTPTAEFTFGTVRWERYQRHRVTPGDVLSSNLLPRIDNLSLRELVLGVALLNSSRR